MVETVRSEGTGTGLILGVVVVILAVIVFLLFGRGYLGGTSNGTQVQIPKQVDVNVNGGGTNK